MSYLCGVLNLPALSVSAPKLLEKIQSDELSLRELSEHLRLDPGIGARLLYVANSPFFGVSGQISSVEEAVMMLGIRKARAFVQVEILKGLVKTPPWNTVDLSGLWRRGLQVGTACQLLASKIGFTDQDAFITGLFHNIGCLVLLQQAPVEYATRLASFQKNEELLSLERGLFHLDHADMGSSVLAEWNFPEDIYKALASQYAEPQQSQTTLQHILQFSHVLLDNDFLPSEEQLARFHVLGVTQWPATALEKLAENIQVSATNLINLLGD